MIRALLRASLSIVLAAGLLAQTEVLVLPERLRSACERDSACSGPKRQIDVRFDQVKAAALEDAAGTARMHFTESDPLSVILGGVKTWRLGREVYDAQCARCHGSDGKLEDYPGIKSLTGIGKRSSEQQILEAVANGGRVDMSGMTSAEKHAVAVYVSGL